MWFTLRDKAVLVIGFATFAALGLIVSSASCSRSEKATAEKQAAQETFASPAAAGVAFLDVAKSGDRGRLVAVFGPDAVKVLLTGDALKDKSRLQDFAAAYNQMHRWREIKVGGEMLYLGADNYLFPVPLGQNPSGQWYFDTAAGKDEILARRIGKNELTAVAALAAAYEAQMQYFRQIHPGDKVKQYAQKFVSDEGRQNGLYWTSADGETLSPLDGVREFANSAGHTNTGDSPQPFNGYFFRILTKQGDKAKGGAEDYMEDGKLIGGFAILAWPAEYRNSGIMTFLVGEDGVVYQKDLGAKTADVAASMTEYNPGDGWKPAI